MSSPNMSPYPLNRTRNMSYRKPVPAFIPSPPPSPKWPSPDGGTVPPLPQNWREVVDRALHLDKGIVPNYNVAKSSSHSLSRTGSSSTSPNQLLPGQTALDLHLLQVQGKRHCNTIYMCDEGFMGKVSPSGSQLTTPSPESPRNKRSSYESPYRPPTAPLPPRYRKRRLSRTVCSPFTSKDIAVMRSCPPLPPSLMPETNMKQDVVLFPSPPSSPAYTATPVVTITLPLDACSTKTSSPTPPRSSCISWSTFGCASSSQPSSTSISNSELDFKSPIVSLDKEDAAPLHVRGRANLKIEHSKLSTSFRDVTAHFWGPVEATGKYLSAKMKHIPRTRNLLHSEV